MTEKDSMDNVTEIDQAAADKTALDSDLEDMSSQAPRHGDDPATDYEEGIDDLSALPPSFEEKLQTAERRAQENHERFLRAAAELDNFRKRKEREVSDLRKYANQMLLRELLGVVDNLERALAASLESSKSEGLREGVEMTLKELLKIFDQFKVTPIESHEQPFDPNHHEAVMQETNDAFPPNTVVRELQKGYMLRDRLLRPAMVVVSK